MSKKISGAEYPLSKIFSSEFEYVIPSYQRPYAWTVDEACELFGDLKSFYDTEGQEGYFLGSIVLIKGEDGPLSEVIDGQQRLTTLTILFAVLSCAHDGVHRDELKSYVVEQGKKAEKIEPKPRLTLRERDRAFFRKYVQEFKLDELAELDEIGLENEARANIVRNTNHLRKAVDKAFGTPDELLDFASFLLTRCYLVAVSTPNEASAFRVFSVMNNRGLDLQPTDIIKADIIGMIKGEAQREEFNDKWEEMEVELTREGFRDLFTYLRMIYAKEKAKRSLLEEFREHVLPDNPDPKPFINDVLEPYAEALVDIRNASYSATSHAETINFYITWLNRIDNSDWIPPAMLFLKKHRNNPALLADFFKRLERLAAYFHVCRIYVNERIDIYGNLIAEIERDVEIDNMDYLWLDENEKGKFRKDLNANVYEFTPRRRNYLLLRLDSFISDGAASYDTKILTIEHVLPQTVNDKSDWAEWWPNADERTGWVHRLANLVPLNRKKNSAAKNYGFKRKCDTYFKGKSNVSSYALTSQVLSEKQWTPKVVEKRQEALLDVLIENWALEEEQE
ncbi:MAG: DUF262 domain-containing HNH endonuclease family protein [Lentilitoribacter sp.]